MKAIVDIDNTLVDYRLAIANFIKNIDADFFVNYIDPKQSVFKIKEIIKSKLGDDIWQNVQSDIYSKVHGIQFYEGSINSLIFLANKGYKLYLISHRTNYGMGSSSKINIREISLLRIFKWIKETSLSPYISGVIFCETKKEKIDLIKHIKPQILIDDLISIHKEYLDYLKPGDQCINFLFQGSNLIEPVKINQDLSVININSWNDIYKNLNGS
ncbi:hypothetical protein HA145_07085 [Prochlorococcus marinus XMU1411]|uniref:hypothetical protein n=1 Tax=Prochlorococcus marinus TaxID=1219 RepID=UPI001ADD4BEE|nr:hypothetical protein [Prochlorococcus marinus]MBO8244239.1 hypothetical protein [Prochlorococcus marinus XMU1411]MBW3055325.1 hypothetical protein [Prochlorococcus marinus str. MU1411]MCR8537067.1 hypothetical protein [Prochlorococcus marinus CUG1430]